MFMSKETAEQSKLASALAWAGRGFRVFPLKPNSKEPMASGWTETATCDADAVRGMWADAPMANIGVLTNDMIVVDVDVKDGKPGLESLLDLNLPLDTLTVRTPSGGLHLYFRGPNRANGVNSLGAGLDVRSWHGYVVAPGSTTPKGEYSLSNEAPVLDAPEDLIRRLDMPKERQSSAPVAELDTPAALDRAQAYLRDEAPPAVEGSGGDVMTFRVAATVKDFGVSEARALDLMASQWNGRCAPPWHPEDLARKVANAYAYGASAPGADNPEAHFRGVDIPPVAEKPAPASRRFFRHGDKWDDATRWLYFGVLPATGTALMVGPSGAGKSFLAVDLAVSLATGRPFFGVEPDERGGTIYIATEAAATLAKRLSAAAPSTRPLPVSICAAGALSDAKQLRSLFDDIAKEAAAMKERFGTPCRLIVLDTLSASGLLSDENDNAKAAAALAELQRLSAATGALVIATHHPPKSGTGERGAGALRANVDAILSVQQEEKAKVRDLELTKSRDAEAPRSLGSYQLEERTLCQDEKGRAITTCIVVAARPTPKAKRRPAHTDAMLTAIDDATITDGEMIQGRKFVSWGRARDAFTHLGPDDSGNCTRAFKAAVAWAVDQGHVELVEEWGRKYLRLATVTLT